MPVPADCAQQAFGLAGLTDIIDQAALRLDTEKAVDRGLSEIAIDHECLVARKSVSPGQ